MKIAIDGPSGAGKSTIAKLLAKHLNIEYLDTGSMYRALAYKLKNYKNISDEEMKIILKDTTINIKNGDIFIDESNVSELIRNESIAKKASEISNNKSVREYLVKAQQNIANDTSIVMDGRDIGAVVLPDADYKFYITADALVRAKRRYNDLLNDGVETTVEQTLNDIRQRDYKDLNRKNSPLIKLEDAVVIDTTNSSVEETVNKMIRIIED